MKKLSRTELRQIKGGDDCGNGCSVTASCPSGGTITCSGINGDAENGGCQKIEGTTISTVSCRQSNGDYTSMSC